ncbi:MAG TPA: hypothetical protein VK421_18145 [Pyrinomonadaceae bacterium]|nr:hypothetical protein [Pyrinomonadaceae bacterium]
MRQTVNRTTDAADRAGVYLRSAVVFASLAALCVSDGIGPRLIPFPSRQPQRLAEPAARGGGAGESRLPVSRAEARAGSGHQPKAVTPVWNNASLDRAAVAPPAARHSAPPDFYNSPAYSFRAYSSARGRAPPRNS